MSIPFTTNVTMINAVSANTTSDPYDVSKRQQITVQFIASGITSGNGVFTLDGSDDGVNWVTGIAFQDAKATASTTWVVSKTVSANGTEACYVKAGFKLLRAKVVFTTDGVYSAVMQNG